MNWRAIRAIVRRDLTVVRRSKPVMLPIVVVPILMLVVIPVAFCVVTYVMQRVGFAPGEMERLMSQLPAPMRQAFQGMSMPQIMLQWSLVYLLAPLYLIVPLMVASVIAADSFAGEKERKTLEALLYTPTSDLDLFVAKLLPASVAAVAVSTVGFVVYVAVADLAAWPVMGRLILPNATWLVLAVWVAPPLAGFGMGATVLISARVRGFQEAYQLGGILVLPVVVLVIGQATGALILNVWISALMGLALWVLDAFLIWLGVQLFRRPKVARQG